MNWESNPEVDLAAAVIERAVADVGKGSHEHRAKARLDIENGCLDYWIEIVCSKHDIEVEVKRRLRSLVS